MITRIFKKLFNKAHSIAVAIATFGMETALKIEPLDRIDYELFGHDYQNNVKKIWAKLKS
jgi:hypothetical protein